MIGTATLSDGPNLTAPVKILGWHTAPWGDRCATVETLPGGTGMWATAGKQFTVNARLLSDIVELINDGPAGNKWGVHYRDTDGREGVRWFETGYLRGAWLAGNGSKVLEFLNGEAR